MVCHTVCIILILKRTFHNCFDVTNQKNSSQHVCSCDTMMSVRIIWQYKLAHHLKMSHKSYNSMLVYDFVQSHKYITTMPVKATEMSEFQNEQRGKNTITNMHGIFSLSHLPVTGSIVKMYEKEEEIIWISQQHNRTALLPLSEYLSLTSIHDMRCLREHSS